MQIDKIIDPHIDETPLKSELPMQYVRRMAVSKCRAVRKEDMAFVLTADTIVVRGRRILGKPQKAQDAETYLKLLSGTKHRVITSVCLAHKGELRVRDVITFVKMKRLSAIEISSYLETEEWKGKAGGYAIQGRWSPTY